MSSAAGPSGQRDQQQGIAAAITEISERASVLVREEIELAKAEMTQKATRLAKGAVVGVAAGVFFLTALFFVLIGCAWLLYYVLPIGSTFTYFWGFFAMALILVVLGALAGFLAARALKAGAPPTPDQAIEEARKIRATVSASGSSSSSPPSAAEASARASTASDAGESGGQASATSAQDAVGTPPLPSPGVDSEDTDPGRGGYGTAISG